MFEIYARSSAFSTKIGTIGPQSHEIVVSLLPPLCDPIDPTYWIFHKNAIKKQQRNPQIEAKASDFVFLVKLSDYM